MKSSLKRLILSKYNYTCQYCGKKQGDRTLPNFTKVDVSVDHITPVSKGGTDDLSNLVCCCVQCNSKKSNRDHLAKEPFRRNSRAVLRLSKSGAYEVHLTRRPSNPLLIPFFTCDK